MSWLKVITPFLLVVSIVGALVAGANSVDSLPYNIRELFSSSNAIPTVLYFALALEIFFLGPAVASIMLIFYSRYALFLFPASVLTGTSATWLMLRPSVPMESLHDILGTPILEWSGGWELFARFLALAGGIWTILCLAGFLVCLPIMAKVQVFAKRLLLVWVEAVFVLSVSWVVVVFLAATDNITELLAWDGHPLSGVMLGGAILVLGINAAFISRAVAFRSRKLIHGAFITLVSVMACYVLVYSGLAAEVTKYGQTFSALQFLLSPSRADYVSGLDLAIRYTIFHSFIIVLVAIIQFPAWHCLELKMKRDA